jgi:hypothetical protein
LAESLVVRWMKIVSGDTDVEKAKASQDRMPTSSLWTELLTSCTFR